MLAEYVLSKILWLFIVWWTFLQRNLDIEWLCVCRRMICAYWVLKTRAPGFGSTTEATTSFRIVHVMAILPLSPMRRPFFGNEKEVPIYLTSAPACSTVWRVCAYVENHGCRKQNSFRVWVHVIQKLLYSFHGTFCKCLHVCCNCVKQVYNYQVKSSCRVKKTAYNLLDIFLVWCI